MLDQVIPTEPGGSQDVFFSRTDPVPLPMLVRAEGVWMWDEEGRDYIDVSSGPVVSNIGHGNKRVAAALAHQAETLDFAYTRVARHHPNEDLAAKIAGLSGPGYERVCLSSGGSEAMEIAIKFFRQYAMAIGRPEKKRLVTLFPSYHGGTLATLAMSGDSAVKPFLDGYAVPVEHVPAPLQYRVPDNHTPETYRMACADALEAKILDLGPENVLAFACEPIGGLATGAQPLMPDYVRRVREICDRYGVYLIFDEVLCGSGRSGTFLASHGFGGVKADAVVLAKGLAAGYAPMAATLFSAQMVDHLSSLTGFAMLHTYTANPICCAAALAVLQEMEDHDLMAKAAVQGAYLRGKLERLKDQHISVGDVRGAGLLLGLELVTDQETKGKFPTDVSPADVVRQHGLEHGLLLYTRRTSGGANGDWLMISPPLTITKAEIDTLIERLSLTLAAFEQNPVFTQADGREKGQSA